MIDSPSVSVLMTAYNREKYIAEAIESVLASTFEDFELIIVDDASTDRTLEIADRYTSDPRVQVHVNTENVGDYPNRNQAASFAHGKYLKYLDSDDVIYPHGLAVMVEIMEKFPQAALGLGQMPSMDNPFPLLIEPREAYCQHYFSGGFFVAGPSGAIIRADAFRALKGFTAMHVAGDTDMWLRLGARYPVVCMMSDLVWWRRHPGQEYQQKQDSYYFVNFHVLMEALTHEHCPLTRTDRVRAIRWMKYRRVHDVLHWALLKSNYRYAFALYRDSGLSLLDVLRGLGRFTE